MMVALQVARPLVAASLVAAPPVAMRSLEGRPGGPQRAARQAPQQGAGKVVEPRGDQPAAPQEALRARPLALRA